MVTKGIKVLLYLIVLVLLIGAGYFGYQMYLKNQALQGTVSELTGTLDTKEQSIAELTHNATSLSDALTAEQQKSAFLQEQANTFASAVQKMTGTVTTLEKLTKTDPELLIKYSKVYFLNEHYTPQKLALIPAQDVLNGKEEYIHANVLPHLNELLTATKSAGVELRIISAYRSFEKQQDLKSQYKVTFGVGANKFSAEQGYSEHQLGTAVDFTTPVLGATFEKIDASTQYFWLQENAYKYGFVLSYPKGNTYYIYEPWHWRYVGVELATKLHDEKRNFYDMDQREISDFLVKIFD